LSLIIFRLIVYVTLFIKTQPDAMVREIAKIIIIILYVWGIWGELECQQASNEANR